MVDQGPIIRDKINNDDKVVAFLDGVRPASKLKSVVELDNGEKEEVLVRNGCYHMWHAHGIAVSYKEHKKHLTPDGRYIITDEDEESLGNDTDSIEE